MRYAYPATLSQQPDGSLLVQFPDVPEALTSGNDRNEALHEAEDALAAALGGYVHSGRPLPAPSPVSPGSDLVALSPLVASKLALYQSMKEQGLTNVALAKQLGLSEGAVRRLLNPNHSSRIEKIETALLALGKHLILEVA